MRKPPIVIISLLILAASSALADPKDFTLDLGHAYVGWEIDHFGYSNTVGQFTEFDGTFAIDEDDLTNSEIRFSIRASSIDSNHRGRDNHLRALDLLNVAEFPTIEFREHRDRIVGRHSRHRNGRPHLHGYHKTTLA